LVNFVVVVLDPKTLNLLKIFQLILFGSWYFQSIFYLDD
jgi:hypothetical protein